MESNHLGCLCHGVETLEGVVFQVKLRQLVTRPSQQEENPSWGAKEETPEGSWRQETKVLRWQQKLFSQMWASSTIKQRYFLIYVYMYSIPVMLYNLYIYILHILYIIYI